MLARDYPTVSERNFVNIRGQTLLHIVAALTRLNYCVRKFEEIIRILLEAGVDSTIRDKMGMLAGECLDRSSPYFEVYSKLVTSRSTKNIDATGIGCNTTPLPHANVLTSTAPLPFSHTATVRQDEDICSTSVQGRP